MEKFVIEGGVPLAGTMRPAGNKNGALPILASAILTEDEVVVANVPRIRDVDAMLSILEAIGVQVSWRGPNEVALCAANVHGVEIEHELAELIRASLTLRVGRRATRSAYAIVRRRGIAAQAVEVGRLIGVLDRDDLKGVGERAVQTAQNFVAV
jgi:UDP-N-acetylglucosamine enolpyruvyl transferase